MSGRGRLFSWVVVHPPVLAAFRDKAPYTIGLVALEEEPQVRLVGMLIDCPVERLEPDMPLRVAFEDFAEVSLPQWKPLQKELPAHVAPSKPTE